MSSCIETNAEQLVFDSASTLPRQVHWNPATIASVNGVNVDERLTIDNEQANVTNTLNCGRTLVENCWDASTKCEKQLTIGNESPRIEPVATAPSRHIDNETRPTVLMLAKNSTNSLNAVKEPCVKNIEKPAVKVVVVKQEESLISLPVLEDNQKWLGALALMELAKTQEEAAARALEFAKNLEHNATSQQTMNYTHL